MSKLFDYIICLIIVSLTFMIIPGWVPELRKSWILLACGTIIGVFSYRNYISSDCWKWLIIYFAVLILNVTLGDKYVSTFPEAIYQLLLLVFPTIILLYGIKSVNYNFIKTVFFVVLSIISITTVLSFIVNLENPEAIRTTVKIMTKEQDMDKLYSFYKIGLSSYSLPHAIPILLPVLVYGCRKSISKKYKVIYATSILLGCVLVFISGAATSLLMSFLLLIILFFVREKQLTTRSLVFLFLLITLSSMINDETKLAFLDYIDNFVSDESSFHGKVMDFKESIIIGETVGDVASREDLYILSFKQFYSNVLIGTNEKMGQHSSLLDFLGAFGLLGFIPMYIYLKSCFKIISKVIPLDAYNYYLLSILSFIVLIFVKSMWVWEIFIVLLVCVPFGFLTISLSRKL